MLDESSLSDQVVQTPAPSADALGLTLAYPFICCDVLIARGEDPGERIVRVTYDLEHAEDALRDRDSGSRIVVRQSVIKTELCAPRYTVTT